MTDTPWSKSPWEYKPRDHRSIRDANGYYITSVNPGKRAKADSLLIAAAPEMAEALQGLLDRYVGMVLSGDCGNWDPEEEAEVIAARAALAKARGQSDV